jgi:hypothetical protein
MIDVAVFVPAFTIDLSAARVDPDTADWCVDDLFDLMGQDLATTAAIALHEMAGRPRTLAYACGSAHLRVLTARYRLAGQSSEFVESDLELTKVREVYDRLLTDRIRILVTRRPYTDGPSITGRRRDTASPPDPSQGAFSHLSRPAAAGDQHYRRCRQCPSARHA